MTARPASDALFKTDKEIAEILGVDYDGWLKAAKAFEKIGMPAREKLVANRRYWPGVKAFLDRRNGVITNSEEMRPDGGENWNENEQRARSDLAPTR